MEAIGNVLTRTQAQIESLTTESNNNFNNLSCYQRVNILLSTYARLINPQFKAWYAKVFHKLTDAQVHIAAERALEGKNPAKCFSANLKAALAS